MNKKLRRTVAKHNRKMSKRLERSHCRANPDEHPVFTAGKNVHYEISDRIQATPYGGIPVMLGLVNQLGLPKLLNREFEGLICYHRPYMESDHVLNIALCHLTGGRQPEDLKQLRHSLPYLDSLGAERIPDATTAGDFCRRFESQKGHHLALMEIFNTVRETVWQAQPAAFRQQAVLDVDGTLCETQGEKKEGIALSRTGRWGYMLQAITLANTGEPLYLINNPGNCVSHHGIAPWIDRALELAGRNFERVLLRGDTDFSLTENFDRWDQRSDFVFGYDVMANLRAYIATELDDQKHWQELQRKSRYHVKTKPRRKRRNYKEEYIRFKEYKNYKLAGEELAEFDYRPYKCKKTYRMIVLRKTLQVTQGQLEFLPETRLFIYITNRRDVAAEQIVEEANQRCNQENLFAQFKSGSGAFKMPLDSLGANWAYCLCATLAQSIKVWFALHSKNKALKERLLKMELPTFIKRMIEWPAQILHHARRIVTRFLDCGPDLLDLLKINQDLRSVRIRT